MMWRRVCSKVCRAVVCAAIWTNCCAAQPAATPPEEDPVLPKLGALSTPTTDELLRGKPTDWIVLLNQDVIFVEPVKPRPGTLEKLKAEYDQLLKVPTSQIPLEEKLEKLAALQRLQVTLLETKDDPEYVIETRFIGQIIHFEDHVLKRVSLLLEKADLTPAYELLMFVDRRQRGWPGFDELYHRFLFLEADRLAKEAKFERALVTAESLFARVPDYADLSRLIGRIIDGQLAHCIAAADFRQARHFLARLKRLIPDHTGVAKWSETLSAQAREVVRQAEEAQRQKDYRRAALLVDQAAVIWPELPSLKESHRVHTDRFQIIRVGIVADGPRSGGYPFPTITSDRRRRLCELPLFEEDHVKDGVVRYRSRFIESWEPRNLGREIHFRMQTRRADWESRPVISSGQIVDAIAGRLDENQPEFDSRWQRDVLSVAATSPWEWELSLSRIPLRIESRLRFDVPMTPEVLEWSGDMVPAAAQSPHQQRFSVISESETNATYRRSRTEPAGSGGWHAAEVSERVYPSWERLLQGLLRAEIDVIPVVEWKDLDALNADRRFLLLPYALPRTHLLQIHPQSVLAENSSLRRAVLHALDRPRIFKTAVVQESVLQPERVSVDAASSKFGRLVTCPFPSTLLAYNAQLQQPDVDPLRAASLVATVQRQLGGKLPTLRLAVPGDPASSRAIPEMIADWTRVGLAVEVISADDQGPWDLAYRTVRLSEPTDDIWTLLHPDGQSAWNGLSIFPHWLRERLWELEQTVDWPTAQTLLQQLETEFLVEARWIPLWEVDEFLLVRRRLTGLPLRPMHPYHDIERWTLQSWYSTDTP